MSLLGDLVLTPRQRVLSLLAVISTSFGVGISFGCGFPLTALTFELWHQPKWVIGLAGAAPAIAVLLALPLLPRLLARLGPVAAITGGCFIGGLGFLALYLFPFPSAWILIRLFMSVGFALPWLAGETWINAVAQEHARGRVIALYAIAFFSGYAVGPVLLQTLGLAGPAPFLAAAFLTAFSSIPIIVGRRLAPEFSHDATRDFRSAFRLAPAAMAGGFIGGFAEISNLSLIPNVALAAGVSEAESLRLLQLMTVGGILLQYPLGWLADKVSRYALTLYLAAAFVVLVLVLPAALGTTAAQRVAVFLLGGVILGFYTLGLSIVGERVSGQDLAPANAAFIVMYQAGAIFGPIASGIAMTASPVRGFVATMVALMAGSAVAVVMLNRSERNDPALAAEPTRERG
jgi:MFS family permease